jgi:hypothetical protein
MRGTSSQAHPNQSLLEAESGFVQGQDGSTSWIIEEQATTVSELAADNRH